MLEPLELKTSSLGLDVWNYIFANSEGCSVLQKPEVFKSSVPSEAKKFKNYYHGQSMKIWSKFKDFIAGVKVSKQQKEVKSAEYQDVQYHQLLLVHQHLSDCPKLLLRRSNSSFYMYIPGKYGCFCYRKI